MISQLVIYLIEVAICLAILQLFYKKIYHNESYAVWNRIYLMASLFVSLILPFANFNIELGKNLNLYNFHIKSITNNGNEFLLVVNNQELNEIIAKLFEHANLVLLIVSVIYISGIIRKLVVFLINIISIIKQSKKSCGVKFRKYKIVRTNQPLSAYSFYKYIFIGNEFYKLNEPEQQQILKHESVHIQQSHTIDLIIVEIYAMFFWFNPIVKQLKSNLKEVHEFIADSLTVEENEKIDYSKLILKLAIKKARYSFVNHFAKNQIRNRILSLLIKEPTRLKKIKFLSALPVLFITLLLFSFTENIIMKPSKTRNTEKEFCSPVVNNSILIMPYFINQNITNFNNNDIKFSNNNNKFIVSHPKLAIQAKSFSPVFSMSSGKIISILKSDNWGLDEYEITIQHNKNITIVYSKLAQVVKNAGEVVEKRDTIAFCGDQRFYSSISIKILKNNFPVDPLEYFNL